MTNRNPLEQVGTRKTNNSCLFLIADNPDDVSNLSKKMAPFAIKLNIYLAKGSVKLKRNISDRSWRSCRLGCCPMTAM